MKEWFTRKALLGATTALSVIVATNVLAASPAPTVPPEVKVVTRGDGWVFTNATGMTLYTFDGDEAVPGKSACVAAACAKKWPALAASSDSKGLGAWTLITRDDGAQQWAYNGHPLYTYAAEGAPSTSFGDGDARQWHTAFQPIWMPPTLRQHETPAGIALTDDKGMTLYTSKSDTSGKSKCNAGCIEKWAPMRAPALANARDGFTAIVRNDGTRQWAYNGSPLYRSVTDVHPGEANSAGETWKVAVLEPLPAQPDWVHVHASLAGNLYADGGGMTLYYHGTNARNAAAKACQSADCWGSEWKAVLAEANAKPAGNWTIVENADDKTRQWAYKGNRLYNSTLDGEPSQFSGIRYGGDRAWTIILRSGEPLQNN